MSTHANMVKMTVTSVASAGVGTITLNAASSGYQSFGTAYGADATVDILITEGATWEVARNCTYTHSGTTVTRGTLEASSTGSAVAFTSAAVVSVVATAASGTRWDQAAHDQSIQSPTSANPTIAVNRWHYLDLSGLTADRTAELPAVAAVGDWVGLHITTGDDLYELLITAASGDTLESIAGGTEWSRLFITGERIVARCIVANTTWVVEQDGRIGTEGSVQGSFTNTTSGSWVVSDLNGLTVDANVGSVVDTANDRILIRRAGKYVYNVTASNTHNTANKLTGTYVRKNGSTSASGTNFAQSATAGSVGTGSGYGAVLAAGDYLEHMYYQNDTTSESCAIGFSVTEVF